MSVRWHRPRRRAPLVSLAALLLLGVALGGCTPADRSIAAESTWHPPVEPGGRPLRAFTDDSWWNTPVPADAPSNPRAAQILRYMRTADQAHDGCVRLTGAEDNEWGQPVYWAEEGDPEYDVRTDLLRRPPELDRLRIPWGARAPDNSDAPMSIIDVARGYAVALTDAVYDAQSDAWSVTGATVTYLASNGLHVDTGLSSDPRNTGSHRGNNAIVMMARLEEVAAGAVEHVLEVGSGPETSSRWVFPMVGSDGDSTDPIAPPQGLRFRIKPSVDLDALDLAPQALVLARALQTYGFYIGDSAGVTQLKLEDTRVEGRGQLWDIPVDALCALPLGPTYWDVLPEGYSPPPPG